MIRPFLHPKFGLRTFLLTLCLLVGLAGCVVPQALVVQPPPESAPATNPADTPRAAISPYLESALAHSPATVSLFAFTNWELLKEIGGVPDLTSAASIDERVDFMRTLGLQEQAVASGFGVSNFLTHAEMWGWDATDLLWEANLTTDGSPVFLLRFPDDFDFAPIFARLDERDYTQTEYAGVPLYSHEMDFSLDWLGTTEFAILNIAFLEDEKLLVLSSSPDSVTAVLDAIAQGPTLLELPGVRFVAAALGDVGSALISPLGCQQFDVASIMLGASPDMLAAILDEVNSWGIRGLYTVFGLGYRVATINGESVPIGVLVHYYPVAEQAKADLRARRRVAESANSFAANRPYAELFEVVDAGVVPDSTGGGNLILSLHALERSPQLFFNMFFQRDLLFSACGGA